MWREKENLADLPAGIREVCWSPGADVPKKPVVAQIVHRPLCQFLRIVELIPGRLSGFAVGAVDRFDPEISGREVPSIVAWGPARN